MKNLLRVPLMASVILLAAGVSTPVFAGPLEPYVLTQLNEISDSLKEMNSQMQKQLDRAGQQDREVQKGACWLDGKSFSQGAEAAMSDHSVRCGLQQKTGWPEWQPVTGTRSEGLIGKDVHSTAATGH